MRILLVAATTFEIRPFTERLTFLEKSGEHLSRYRFKEVAVDVLIPGIGMVPTAFHTGKQIALQHYDLAINAGIAGTFIKSIPLGSVVNVTEDCVPELGAEDGDNFLSVFTLGLTDPDTLPYSGGKLVSNQDDSPKLCNMEVIRKLPRVTAITSNTIRGNLTSIARIRQIAAADIESMEGAAFFYACLSEKIPCLQIRSISNRVEVRDKSRWNLDLALKNLNRILWEIAGSYTALD
jgi:futalosine hydrolase